MARVAKQRVSFLTNGLKPLTFRLLALGLTALLGQQAAVAQLPTTQLTTIRPPGGKFGTTLDVTVGGGDQDEVQKLVFSHPGITATPKMTAATEFVPAKPVQGQFSVTIAGDVPPGIYDARVVGRYGVSNPRAFAVGVYEELNDSAGNNSPEKAVELKIDSTLSGTVDGNTRDYAKLKLNAGQRVLVDVAAWRLDSRLNPTVVLSDESGKELVRRRGFAGEDPFIDFTAPREAEYMISVYDFTYRGGGEHFYRLTAHVGPHIDFVFPPAGVPGTTGEFTLYGRNLPGGKPSELKIGGQALEQLAVQIPVPGSDELKRRLETGGKILPVQAFLDGFTYRVNSANPVAIYFASEPVTLEVEPNSEPANVQTITVPCEVAGMFYPERDIDWYQFEAKKGETFQIDVFSHRLGHRVDPRIVVQKVTKNDKGEESVQDISNVDDPGDRNGGIGRDFDTTTDDPSYRLTADADAIYRLRVRDQFGDAVSDPRRTYRLAIQRVVPDFRLVAVAKPIQTPPNANAVRIGTVILRKGGTAAYDVLVERRNGFASDIELFAEGLPEGVTTRKSYIRGNSNTGTLILEAKEDTANWSGTIRIRGKAVDSDLVRFARSGVSVWPTGNRQTDPASFRASQDLQLAVAHELSPTLVEAGESKIWETSLGGTLEIPLKIVRRRGFAGDLKLVATGLPGELKPGDITVKGDAAEGKLAFAATKKNVKTGLYTFYLRADTKGKFVRNPDAIPAAEAEQKRLDGKVKELEEALKQANAAKDAAVKATEAAQQAVKTAEDALTKAANEAKEAAQAAVDKAKQEAEQANTAKAAAEKAAADTDAKVKAVQAAKKAADQNLEAVKKANAAKDFNFVTVSTPVHVKIVSTPLGLATAAPELACKAGTNAELTLKLDRKYGFADNVELTLEVPKGVAGVSAPKVTVNKDQAEGKLVITAAKEATVGDHTLTVRAKAKFNNLDVATTQTFVLKVQQP